MDRTERFHLIDMMLTQRGVVSFQTLLDRLEVSRATLKRDLEYLRNRLNAPIVWDREAGGYRFDRAEGGQSSCLGCGLPPRRSTPCSPCSTCLPTSTQAAYFGRTSSR
jgi:hypothetical protein